MTRFAPYEPDPARRPASIRATVQLACDADVPAMASMMVEREGGDHADHAGKLAHALAAREGRALFVARVADEPDVVGFGRVGRIEVPPDLPDAAPTGWYLQGMIVAPGWRRRGIGVALVETRLTWLASRTHEVFYCANAENRASIDLHARFGFELHRERFTLPGVTFEGRGLLFRCVR